MVSQLNFCLGKLGAILQSWQIAHRGRIVLKWKVTIQLIEPPPPPPKETKFYWRWGGGGEQRDYILAKVQSVPTFLTRIVHQSIFQSDV